MDVIWVAAIAGIVSVLTGVVGPMLTAFFLNRNRRAEKVEDWKRQDEVAAQLLERQDAIAAQTAEAARLLVASDKRVADTARETQAQLKVIHTLVNSNLTASMQAALDAQVSLLAALLEIVDLKGKSGFAPTTDALATVESTKAKIAELQAVLLDRRRMEQIKPEELDR